MGAYDYLIHGANNVDIPSPYDITKARLTLGELANTNAIGQNTAQMGAMDVQQRQQLIELMKQPEFAQMYAGMLGGGSDGSSVDTSALAGLLQRYPVAGGTAFTNMLGTVEKAAQIRKTNADAGKAATDMKTAQMQVLSNAAGGLADAPGPLMPDKVMALLRQAQYVGAQPLMTDIVSAVQSGDEGAIRGALKNFSQAGSTLAQRAGAGKDIGDTALQGPNFDLARYKAMVEAAKAQGGEVRQDVNGNLVIVRPLAGANMPTPPGPAMPQRDASGLFPAGTPTQPVQSLGATRAADAAGQPVSFAAGPQATPAPAAPVAPASGPGNGLPMVQPIGVQGAMSPGEAAQNTVRTQTLTESRKSADAAQESMLLLPALRSTLAQGYTGPIAASPVGRQLLNLAVSTGAISQADAAQVASMRMSDAIVTKLLGPMAHSLSQRGMTAQSQKLIEASKPGTENSQPIADAMITSLMNDARNSIKYDTALNGYVTRNPNDYGLSGWPANAPKPDLPPPPGQRAEALPPASVANVGMKAYDADTGRVYINRTGSKWELQ